MIQCLFSTSVWYCVYMAQLYDTVCSWHIWVCLLLIRVFPEWAQYYSITVFLQCALHWTYMIQSLAGIYIYVIQHVFSTAVWYIMYMAQMYHTVCIWPICMIQPPAGTYIGHNMYLGTAVWYIMCMVQLYDTVCIWHIHMIQPLAGIYPRYSMYLPHLYDTACIWHNLLMQLVYMYLAKLYNKACIWHRGVI